jgi:TetR/AcrR family tetracycline transcriptional repressor
VSGYLLLFSIVNGFTMDETGEGGDPPADQPPHDEAAAMVRDYMATLPPERFPNLIELADHFALADPDERYELLIDLFVDGLAKRANAKPT